jgi:hypothetical protein
MMEVVEPQPEPLGDSANGASSAKTDYMGKQEEPMMEVVEPQSKTIVTMDLDNMLQDMDSILGNIQDGIRK